MDKKICNYLLYVIRMDLDEEEIIFLIILIVLIVLSCFVYRLDGNIRKIMKKLDI